MPEKVTIIIKECIGGRNYVIKQLRSISGLSNDVRPTLFFEFIGSPTNVQEQIQTVKWCTEEAEGKKI